MITYVNKTNVKQLSPPLSNVRWDSCRSASSIWMEDQEHEDNDNTDAKDSKSTISLVEYTTEKNEKAK